MVHIFVFVPRTWKNYLKVFFTTLLLRVYWVIETWLYFFLALNLPVVFVFYSSAYLKSYVYLYAHVFVPHTWSVAVRR